MCKEIEKSGEELANKDASSPFFVTWKLIQDSRYFTGEITYILDG